MGVDAMILVFWMLNLRQLFHSPLSCSSVGFLVPLTFCHKGGIICISEIIDISPSNLDSSWQVDGETMETVRDFIFLGSKITADGDCSHEIKRCLLLGRKAMTKPRQCFKKQRHYFAYKDPNSESYIFPAVMYGCETWTIKKAECWRIDAFELWCWRRLLRVPSTTMSSNQ